MVLNKVKVLIENITIVLILYSFSIVGAFADTRYDKEVVEKFQKYAFDTNKKGGIRKLSEISDGRIVINAYEGEGSKAAELKQKISHVLKNIRIDQVNFEVYQKYRDHRVIMSNHISIAYGTKQSVMSSDLYKAISFLSGDQAIIELGYSLFDGQFDLKNYKSTGEFDYICSGFNFSWYDRDVNISALVLIEENDKDSECMYNQIFHFLGFRSLRNYSQNPWDLSEMYRLLRENIIVPGMNIQEFEKIKPLLVK